MSNYPEWSNERPTLVQFMDHHRTWFKVLFNPLLRRVGCSIVSYYNDETQRVEGYAIKRYPEFCRVIPEGRSENPRSSEHF